jgi:hypothetical protein
MFHGVESVKLGELHQQTGGSWVRKIEIYKGDENTGTEIIMFADKKKNLQVETVKKTRI